MRSHLALATFVLCGVAVPVLAALPEDTSTCQVLTQTVTTTITVPVSIIGNSQVIASSTSLAFNAPKSTFTSYSTLTNFITILEGSTNASPIPATISASASAVSSSSVYYYVDNNGSTSWLNASPAITYSSYLTETIEVTVYPQTAPTAHTVTIFSTEVFTLPPATSVSVQPSALEYSSSIQLQIPTTLTITSHLTEQVTLVGTLASATGPSEGSATISGPGSHGWNASSKIANSTAVGPYMTKGSAASLSRVPVTLTESVQYANATAIGALSTTGSSGFRTNTSSSILLPYLTGGPSSGISAYGTFPASSLVSPVSQSNFTASSSSLYKMTSMLGTGSLGGYPTTVFASTPASSSSFTKVYTNITSAAAATPSVCGEYGDFMLTWDDEPNFSPTVPITDPYEAAPVFNPYHHFSFSDGFVYVPEPTEPFPPISSPHLVMFLTNETGPTSSTDAGLERSGEIGTGDRASSSAFWFNAYSAYLGCDNDGPDACIMQISAYVWQASSNSEILAYQQNATLPPCPGFKDCKLEQVNFATSMKGLSGVRIQAFVGTEQKMWFMDNLAMGWYNNTCSAGLIRQMSS